jgi:hypothetical protein
MHIRRLCLLGLCNQRASCSEGAKVLSINQAAAGSCVLCAVCHQELCDLRGMLCKRAGVQADWMNGCMQTAKPLPANGGAVHHVLPHDMMFWSSSSLVPPVCTSAGLHV